MIVIFFLIVFGYKWNDQWNVINDTRMRLYFHNECILFDVFIRWFNTIVWINICPISKISKIQTRTRVNFYDELLKCVIQ